MFTLSADHWRAFPEEVALVLRMAAEPSQVAGQHYQSGDGEMITVTVEAAKMACSR